MSDEQPDFTTYTVQSSLAWLQRPNGEAWSQVHGLLKDALVGAAQRAAVVDLPGTTTGDALPLLGFERSLERAPGEAQEPHRARLEGAWEQWAKGGRDDGLLEALTIHGFPGAFFFNARTVDPGSPIWARIWLVLTSTPWSPDGTWDDPGTWDDGGVWDSTASVDDINRLVRLIRTWKAARTRCVSVALFLVPTAELWDYPFGTWDEPGGVWGKTTDIALLYPEDYPV